MRWHDSSQTLCWPCRLVSIRPAPIRQNDGLLNLAIRHGPVDLQRLSNLQRLQWRLSDGCLACSFLQDYPTRNRPPFRAALEHNFGFEILALDIALEVESGFFADVMHGVILLKDLSGDTIELFAASDLDKAFE